MPGTHFKTFGYYLKKKCYLCITYPRCQYKAVEVSITNYYSFLKQTRKVPN